ncbi:MAG TPA: DMT family transporter [Alphaproteobacteria bacterium]|nr:DMT family transporter [Alphaproteobacteria bacterium]
MAPRHLALVIFTMVIWGTNIIANKVVVDAMPPLFFAAIWFVIVLVCIFPWLRIVPGRMKRIFMLAMLIGGLHFGLFFVSLKLAGDASVLAIVIQLYMPLAALAGMVLLGEKIGWQRAGAMTGAFIGIVIIVFDARVFSYIDAVIIMIVAQMVYAIAAVLLRSLQGINVMQLQAWNAAFGMPALLAMSLLVENGQWESLRHLDLVPWLCLVYSAFGGAIFGHGAMMYLYQRYPVSQVVIYTLLSPVVAVITGVLVLHEHISAKIIVGGLITLSSVAIYFRRAKKLA